MVHRIRTSDIPEVSRILTRIAATEPPPVMWSSAKAGWIDANSAPLDPALWRPRMAEYLYAIDTNGPASYGLPDLPMRPDGYPLSLDGGRLKSWHDLGESIRYLSAPVVRDLKEILSGEPTFRQESGMTPERWLSQCAQSAAGFTSRADLLAAFRATCPDAAIGQRAFLALARQLLGRDGRFGPRGAKGPWGFRVTLP